MSVRLILGSAGSGKSGRLLDEAGKRLRARSGEPPGGGVVFLSPSAAASDLARSDAAEKLGGALLGVRFETFSTLARRVLAAAGRPAGRTAGGVLMRALAAAVIDRERARLTHLSRIAESPGLPGAVVDFAMALESAGVSAAEFEEAAAAAARKARGDSSRLLLEKSRDLALIAGGIAEAMARGGLAAPRTLASAALRALREGPPPEAVRGGLLLVDGFGRFTPVELGLLSRLAGAFGDVRIALTLSRGGLRPFEETERTRRLLHGAISGIEEEDVSHSDGASPVLAHVARELFASPPSRRLPAGESIEVLSAPSEDAECRLVARRILDLHDSGAPLGEIGIFLRSGDDYAPALACELSRFGLPFDSPGLTSAPPTAAAGLLIKWIDAVFAEPREVDLVGCLRGRLEPEAAWLAESASASWGSVGLDEAEALAAAAGPGASREILACAAEIRSLRERFNPGGGAARSGVEPEAFAEAAEAAAKLLRPGGDGADEPRRIAESSYAEAVVRAARDCAEASGLAGTVAVPLRLHQSRLSAALAAAGPPRGAARAGAVLVRSVYEPRTPPLRAAFVMGLAEGRWPPRRREGPFLTDRELAGVSAELGRELPASRISAEEEDLLFYIAATRATERLVLTYPAADESGKESLPSAYLDDLASLFEGGIPGMRTRPRIEAVPELGEVRTAGEARARLALDLSRRPGSAREAMALAGRCSALHEALRSGLPGLDLSAASPVERPDIGGLSDERALAWVGRRTSRPLSPSAVEDFTQCPFRHFVKRTLALEAEGEPGITPLVEGEALHRAMAAGLAEAGGRPLHEAGLEGLLREALAALDGYIGAELGPMALAGRGRASSELLRRRLRRLIEHEVELSRETKYVPRLFEISFGRDERALSLGRGEGRVPVEGRIDRVDVLDSPEGKWAVAIDYKRSGVSERPKRDLMASARQAQLPIYAIALERALGLRAAGAVLCSAKTLKRRGMQLDSHPLPGAGRNDLVLDDELRRVLDSCEAAVLAAAAEMRRGRMEILPADAKPCRSCEARDICRYDRWEWWRAFGHAAAADDEDAADGEGD